jgi:hypothetical protein
MLVEHIKSFWGGKENLVVEVFGYARDVVTLTYQVWVIVVRAEYVDMVSVVSAEASTTCTVPDKALSVLQYAMHIGDGQLLLSGQLSQYIFVGLLGFKWTEKTYK